MSTIFDPNKSPIVVEGWVTGPTHTSKVSLAVDTGASGTLIGATILAALGIAIPSAGPRRRIRAVTGGATAPVVNVRQLFTPGSTHLNCLENRRFFEAMARIAWVF